MFAGLTAHRINVDLLDFIGAPDRYSSTRSRPLEELVLETAHYPNRKIWPGSILEFL